MFGEVILQQITHEIQRLCSERRCYLKYTFNVFVFVVFLEKISVASGREALAILKN